QRKFDSKYANEDFEKKYIDIVTFQKPYMTPELLERMLGRCTFEKDEHRAPKNSYTFERFMLLQKVNNLNIKIDGEKIEISKEQKINEINYKIKIKNKEEVSEEEIVKKVETQRFIKLEGWHKIRLALKANNKEEKFKLIEDNPELQNILADALIRNKTDE